MNKLIILLWITSFFLVVTSLNKCGQDASEISDYLRAQMPYDVFVKYSQIDYEYGFVAADYWLSLTVEQDFAKAENLRARVDGKEIDNAIKNGFVIPFNPERDKEILTEYKNLKQKLPNFERRSNQSERWRDFFAYIGGAAIVGLCAFLLEKNCKKQT